MAFTLSRLLNGVAEKYTPALSLWNGTIVGMSEKGLKIAEISETDYRDFASRHATSPEIGPIQTSFDPSVKEKQKREFEQVLVGLWGCDNLCAVADFHIYPSETDSTKRALKLDSVIVPEELRRRSLASLLVAQIFTDLLSNSGRKIASIYAHSVHPATVRLLRRLQFNDPNVLGAPISHIALDAESRENFVKDCEGQVRDRLNRMKLQCAYCRNGDKRARPWCLPRGEKPPILTPE